MMLKINVLEKYIAPPSDFYPNKEEAYQSVSPDYFLWVNMA